VGEKTDNNVAESFFQRMSAFWKCQLIGWGMLVPYAFLTRVAFWKDYPLAAAMTLCLEPLGFILSLGLRRIYLKITLKRLDIRKVIVVVLGASFLAAVAEFAVSEWVLSIMSDQMGSNRSVRLTFFWLLFAFWSLGYFWLRNEFEARQERKRLDELEISTQRAELSMLRLQLNPHFLFNSLTNIAEEIKGDPTAAVAMTGQLAKFLRYTLERQDERIVPLADEIEAVRNYLAIEEIRFRNRLSTKIYISHGLENVRLPCLLLQPLVENAVKHGVMSCSPPWKLTVEVDLHESSLHLRVSNTGTLLKDWQTRRKGIGLANLMKRLELHYPDGRHRFELFQEQDQVIADLVLDGAAVDV